MEYNLDYFINKFEKIPEKLWLCGQFSDEYGEQRCALGHCGFRVGKEKTLEGDSLLNLTNLNIAKVNDGYENYLHYGSTPKQRVVNYLKSLR